MCGMVPYTAHSALRRTCETSTAIAHCCSATQMPGFTEVWERHVGIRYRARAFGISGALSLCKDRAVHCNRNETSSAIQGVPLPRMSCR